MNTAKLTLSYQPEDEWHGELIATVKSGEFAGKSSAWFTRQHLRENLISALRMYPLSASNPPMVEGGYWSKDSIRKLDQCHLRIAVQPYDSRGSLLVQVDLATGISEGSNDVDQQSLTARFLIEYAALEEFSNRLEQMLNGTRNAVELCGTAT